MVFLPFTLLPLHVFEPRYRALVRDVLQRMVCSRFLNCSVPRSWRRARSAGTRGRVGRIVQHQTMPDGRSNIVLAGIGRARILREIPGDTPYRVVQARPLPAPSADSARAPAPAGGPRDTGPAGASGLPPVQTLLERDVETPGLCAAVAHMLIRTPTSGRPSSNSSGSPNRSNTCWSPSPASPLSRGRGMSTNPTPSSSPSGCLRRPESSRSRSACPVPAAIPPSGAVRRHRLSRLGQRDCPDGGG